jgi:cell division protein FtsQ
MARELIEFNSNGDGSRRERTVRAADAGASSQRPIFSSSVSSSRNLEFDDDAGHVRGNGPASGRGSRARNITLDVDGEAPSSASRSRSVEIDDSYMRGSTRASRNGSSRDDEYAPVAKSGNGNGASRKGSRKVASDDDAVMDLDDEDVQFLRTEKRVAVRKALPKKTVQKLKLAGVILAIAAVVIGTSSTGYSYAMHSWRFRIDSSDAVEISGVKNASRAHVMEVAAADIGRNIFAVSLEDRKKQLEQIPWVESASVMRLWPNHIGVEITERTPVAFVQIGSRISLIDANGVVMGMPANRQTKYSFPIIIGMTGNEPLSSRAAAMKIYNRLANELDSAGPDGPQYTRQLSEVDLSDPEDVKVTANEGGGALLIHLGGSDFMSHYKLYLDHIGEWRQQFQNLQSVDLRYEGQIVVNPDANREPPKEQPVAVLNAPEPGPVQKPIHHGGAAARRKPGKAAKPHR